MLKGFLKGSILCLCAFSRSFGAATSHAVFFGCVALLHQTGDVVQSVFPAILVQYPDRPAQTHGSKTVILGDDNISGGSTVYQGKVHAVRAFVENQRLGTVLINGVGGVTEQKTGKKRQVGLPEPLLSDLKKNAGKWWVFPGRDPRKHRTRQAVWKDVKRAARAFRLPQNVGPHSARKVYAVDLMRKYGDIDRVKRALNHSSETVTMIYAMADAQLAAKNRRRKSGSGHNRS